MEIIGFDLRIEKILNSLTLDVLKSSEIEGAFFNPDQVHASIASRLGSEIVGAIYSDRNVGGGINIAGISNKSQTM